MTVPVYSEFLSHACSFCRRHITEFDVDRWLAQAKRKKLPQPQPGEVCCKRKDCVKVRRARLRESVAVTAPDQLPKTTFDLEKHDNPADSDREVELFTGASSTRRNEDGVVRKEKSRPDVLVISSHELADWRSEHNIKKTYARDSQQIVLDLLDRGNLEERCYVHETPGCTTCLKTLDSLKRIVPGTIKKIKPGEPASVSEPPLPSLEEEAKMIILNRPPAERKRIEEEERKKYAPKYRRPHHSYRLEKTKKQVKISEPKAMPSLRLEHGYEVRQIATLLDDSRINAKRFERSVSKAEYKKLCKDVIAGKRKKRVPNTEEELLRELSVPMVPIFDPDDVRLYKDYAAGNIPKDTLRNMVNDGIYGRKDSRDPNNLYENRILRIENDVIKRAWLLQLLTPANAGCRSRDLEQALEESWSLEAKAIQTGAASIGGSIISGRFGTKPGSTFTPRKLNSFEHGGQITRRNDADDDFSQSTGGVTHDDYSEESAA